MNEEHYLREIINELKKMNKKLDEVNSQLASIESAIYDTDG